MRRHRSGAAQQEESSSDEEDAFEKMPSRKNKKAKIKEEPSATTQSVTGSSKEARAAGASTTTSTTMPPSQSSIPALSATVTSSMKRHHSVSSDTRKAKMDALLTELEEAKQKVRRTPYPHPREARGSFVEAGEEHLTTNIFVDKLPPTMTEERLTDLFQQFGETLLVLKLCDCRVMLV
jgi:RNA recognition motif-containing protein